MIQAVILDWAGTAVDYGCFAPVEAFRESFRKQGIEVTTDEVRQPMGLLKIDHIRTMCRMETVAARWREAHGRLPDEKDVAAIYADFEPLLFSILPQYASPVPGLLELVERLRERGLAIGSTTGYTAEMMQVVAEEARKQGYTPDMLVTPSEVPAGRPAPWMIFRNAEALGVYPMHTVVKCGDTISDIREGLAAGCWSVGVLRGGSELGMSEAEVRDAEPELLKARLAEVTQRFYDAGAHLVIDSIGELDQAIDRLNDMLEEGAKP